MMNDPKIYIYIPEKNSKLLANVSVTLTTLEFGKVTQKWFQIWESRLMNERLLAQVNITPPTVRIYSRYHPQVYFEDVDKWYELEMLIYKAYLDKINPRSEEKVDPDEIPI